MFFILALRERSHRFEVAIAGLFGLAIARPQLSRLLASVLTLAKGRMPFTRIWSSGLQIAREDPL